MLKVGTLYTRAEENTEILNSVHISTLGVKDTDRFFFIKTEDLVSLYIRIHYNIIISDLIYLPK